MRERHGPDGRIAAVSNREENRGHDDRPSPIGAVEALKHVPAEHELLSERRRQKKKDDDRPVEPVAADLSIVARRHDQCVRDTHDQDAREQTSPQPSHRAFGRHEYAQVPPATLECANADRGCQDG